jgi:hypothetical protein
MSHQQQPAAGPLGDLPISLIRTGVPLVWGYAAAWLISLGIPASFLTGHRDVVVSTLTAMATFAWYALWRTLETRLPKLDSWVARLAVIGALGHPAAPTYAGTAASSVIVPAPR